MRVKVGFSENYSMEEVRTTLNALKLEGVAIEIGTPYRRLSAELRPPHLIIIETDMLVDVLEEAGPYVAGALAEDAWNLTKRLVRHAWSKVQDGRRPSMYVEIKASNGQHRLDLPSLSPGDTEDTDVWEDRLDAAIQRLIDSDSGLYLAYSRNEEAFLTLEEYFTQSDRHPDAE